MKEESNKLCSGKAILAIIIFAIAIIACVVVIVVLVLKTGNNMNSYYLSDKICEKDETGKEVCYRKINVNMEHYISELDEKVVRTHVRYENRYGIELAADLYTPKNLDKSKKYIGIIIGPPYGGVKEQGPSVYANYLTKSEHNYVCLAFDPSFNGESGGKKRKVSSSDIFVEDFSAGVDYLGTLSYIDRDKIVGIGICGSGGFLLGAAAIDSRIKAVISVVMYDIPRINHNESDWEDIQNKLKKKRWDDVDNGKQEVIDLYKSDRVYYTDSLPSFPQDPEFDEYWKPFYTTERGHHPRSTGGFTTTSQFSLANLQVTDNIANITSPILFITSWQVHSFNYTIDTYNYLIDKGKNDSFLVNVSNADVERIDHIDFYDNINIIPFKQIFSFLESNLTN